MANGGYLNLTWDGVQTVSVFKFGMWKKSGPVEVEAISSDSWRKKRQYDLTPSRTGTFC
jgi:hypothetical protein